MTDKARTELVSQTLWKYFEEGLGLRSKPKDEYDYCARAVLEALDRYDEKMQAGYAELAKDPEFQEWNRRRLVRERHEPDGRECVWLKGKDDELYCKTHDTYKPLRKS